MRIIFSPTALEHYEFWKKTDGKIIEKIKSLLRDMSEHPFTGIGKPEPLKGNLRGVWSRRITSTHRLLYEVKGDEIDILVLSMKYHYKQK